MNFKKPILPFLVALGFVAAVNADIRPREEESSFNRNLNERDWSAIDQYLEARQDQQQQEQQKDNKKTEPVLEVSGDVRTEWRFLSEREDGLKLRPRKELSLTDAVNHSIIPADKRRKIPLSHNDFDVELNLKFEYTTDKSWAFAQLQFDNSMGVDDNDIGSLYDPEGYHGSATEDQLSLKRAYWGYNIYTKGCRRFDIEVGRKRLFDVFSSKVQYLSRFDGMLLKYSDCFQSIDSCGKKRETNWYLFGAAFVVDEKVDHFAFATEIGFLDIQNTGLDLRYSFIHWNKYGYNRFYDRRSIFANLKTDPLVVLTGDSEKGILDYRFHNPRGFRFQNSQFSFLYNIDTLDCWKKFSKYPSLLYGGVVYNHNAGKIKYLSSVEMDVNGTKSIVYALNTHKKMPWAFYLGYTIGRVKKEGDLSFDIQWQWVGANSIPDDDVSGIGRGNTLGESFTCNGRGNTNYQGMRFEALYAITDDLTLDSIIEFSNAICKKIGGPHHYSKFELEAIYAF